MHLHRSFFIQLSMKFYELICRILENINTYLLDYLVCFALIFSGIYFTLKLKFVQIRCFKEGLKNAFGGIFKGDRSSFRSLMTAIGAQVGTGNIVGAASAILIGGAGSVFWMWVIAFFGMATMYSEAVLAQKFAVYNNAEKKGGPLYYILGVFKGRWGKILSKIFAVATVIGLSITGTMVQSNAVAFSFNEGYRINSGFIGIVLATLCAFAYLGGSAKLMKMTEKIVPLMSFVFIVSCFIVLMVRAKYLPTVFGNIFTFAFRPKALLGSTVGVSIKTCISQGVKRGLFSNEAGMGSTPHAHAVAMVSRPHEQGTVAMIGVFFDTFVILSVTALVMLSYLCVGANIPSINENNLMAFSLQSVLGRGFGSFVLNISLFMFGFTSIISWNYFGRLNFEYLFFGKGMFWFYILSIFSTYAGTVINNKLVWNLSDFALFFMIMPNLLALFKGRKLLVWAK